MIWSPQLRRQIIPLALCGTVLALTSACSSVSEPTEMAPMALTTYRATVAAGSADVSSSFVLASPAGSTTETGSGIYSWASNVGELTYRIEAKLTSFEENDIISGDDEYSQLSTSSTPGAPNGSKWSETTWTGPSSDPLGSLFFGAPGPPNPGALLQLLDSKASSITNLGNRRIGAVDTTHYLAEIPLSDLDVGTTEELEQAEHEFGTTSLGVGFWVDSSQLLRRLTFGISIHRLPAVPSTEGSAVTAKLPITATATLNVSNYGVPVDVTPPPAGDVTPGGTCQRTPTGFNCSDAF